MIVPTVKSLFKSHFRIVSGTRFTNREIDIIACMLNGHWHSKEVANVLQISTKTIDNYITDILGKLGPSYRYRYQIVDFFNEHGEYDLLKNTYFNLISEQKILQQIINDLGPKLKHQHLSVHIKSQETGGSDLTGLITQIKTDLTELGITVSQNTKPGTTIGIELTTITNAGVTPQLKIIIDIPDQPSHDATIGTESYGRILCSILSNLPSSIDISQELLVFSQSKQPEPSSQSSSKPSPKQLLEKIKKNVLKLPSMASIAIVFSLVFGGWFFNGAELFIEEHRGELSLPNDKKLLVRQDIIHKINESFKNQKGIKSVALIGIGGSGKTTIASYYASNQPDNTVWRLNAKDLPSLLASYEEILISMSKDKEELEKVRQLDNITNKTQKIKALLTLLTNKLRSQPSWFLVMDNVQDFDDISAYFPLDQKVWGKGSILITTRNKNISLNQKIGDVILINELSPEEKSALFRKNFQQAKNNQAITDEDINKFLEIIPSYPLDVITCASYLNTTKVSFSDYRSLIQQNQNEVADFEKVIMSSVTNYDNTRYNIIKASLDEMIKEDQKFGRILFFLSIIDNKNIPIKFIKLISDNTTVDKFIFDMNKYSLITETLQIDGTTVISIHDKTHSLIKSYVEVTYKDFHPGDYVNEIFSTIIKNLQHTVFEESNLPETKLLLNHYVRILQGDLALKPKIEQDIYTEVGRAYFYLGNYIAANGYLEKSLDIYRNINSKTYTMGDLRLLSFIGDLYGADMRRGLRPIDIPKVKEIIHMLEAAVTSPHKTIKDDFIVESKMYLGVLYQHLGWLEVDLDYWERLHTICQRSNASQSIKNLRINMPNKKGLIWFRKSYKYTKHVVQQLEKDPSKKARLGPAYHYLAVNCALLGKNVKAIAYSTKAHETCLANYPKENIRIGWSFLMQAMTNTYLENYDEAIQAYRECLANFENHFSKEDSFIFFVANNLALNLHRVGRYEESNKILKELIAMRGISSNNNRNKTFNILIKNLFNQIHSGSNKKIQSMIDGYTALLCGEVNRMEYFKDKED